MCHVCVGWGVDGACLPEVNGLGVYVDHASRRGSWRWGSSGGQSTMFDLYMHVVNRDQVLAVPPIYLHIYMV